MEIDGFYSAAKVFKIKQTIFHGQFSNFGEQRKQNERSKDKDIVTRE